MANHEVEVPPVLNLNLRRLEETDPAHADVLNLPLGQLVNNDAALAEHALDAAVHVSEADRLAWAEKAVARTFSAVLTVSGWSAAEPFTQAVAVAGLTAELEPIVDVRLSAEAETAKEELKAYGFLSKLETGAGTLLAVCLEKKPETELHLQLKVVQ